jgi:hypothetical protein
MCFSNQRARPSEVQGVDASASGVQSEFDQPIGFPDLTPALARESRFLGIVDLLKVAKHGKGENIYLVRFHYVAPRTRPSQRTPVSGDPSDERSFAAGVADLTACSCSDSHGTLSLGRALRIANG